MQVVRNRVRNTGYENLHQKHGYEIVCVETGISRFSQNIEHTVDCADLQNDVNDVGRFDKVIWDLINDAAGSTYTFLTFTGDNWRNLGDSICATCFQG